MKTVSDFSSLATLKNKKMELRKVPRWYAIYTRSRYEKKVSMELEERGLEHFLPLVPQLRNWKDRKKIVNMPIFPGYVFVNIKLSEKIRVLRANGVVRFIEFNGSCLRFRMRRLKMCVNCSNTRIGLKLPLISIAEIPWKLPRDRFPGSRVK